MKTNVLVFISLLLCASLGAQSITLSGYVRNAQTSEALIGATIFEINHANGTTSNEYGFYTLTLSAKDTIGLIFSYLGYQPQAKQFFLKTDQRLDVFLEENTTVLEEAVIRANVNNDNVQRAQMGVIDVPMRAILNLPAIAGERDILKIIQLLPGVQAGQEGTTGYFVRGGNLDQNLVQLDEATVYNPNHLFGLFSTFNTNAINHVKLIKGGFPPEFGGRLSSILDIQMKEGDKSRFRVEGGVGLLSNNLTLQGPLIKNKASFIVSGRLANVNYLLKRFSPHSSYTFYDFNAKMNYELGKKDRLYLSFFKGNDNAVYNAANSLLYSTDFGNTTGTFRWNHLFGNKVFSNLVLVYNDYHLGLNTEQNSYYSSLFTGIKDVSAKADFAFQPNPRNTIKTGFSYTYHTLYPAAFSANIPRRGNRLSINKDSIEALYSNELALYFGHEFEVSKKLSINYGLRVPVFVVATKTYAYTEPRFTAKLELQPSSSLKLSYTQMHQFLHLIPNSTAGIPTDIWLPSTVRTKPQFSTQYALGYFQNFKENTIEASVEVYYKQMSNQALFAEGNQLRLNTNLDSSLVYGSGISYGAEFFVRKNTGRLTGWISYTWSKTTQTFTDLNFGEAFPFRYDRRHSLSITGSYQLNPKWSLNGIFVYASGTPFTLPAGRVTAINAGTIFEGNYFLYEGRNNARLNPYHRLDLSLTYKNKWKFFKIPGELECIFGIYNAYSHQNPYFVYFLIEPRSNKPIANQVSLLPIVPSLSFNFKF